VGQGNEGHYKENLKERPLGVDPNQNGSIRNWEISRGGEGAGKKSERKERDRNTPDFL
jgi:hypothetical protein